MTELFGPEIQQEVLSWAYEEAEPSSWSAGRWLVPGLIERDPYDAAYDQLTHDEFLTFRLSVLSAAFDRKAARVLSERFGVTLAERRVLGAVVSHDRVRFSELVKYLTIDGAQISRAASALIERGLIRRSPDPLDGRSWILSPTARGRLLDQKIVNGGRENQRAILSNLTSEERITFYQATAKLLDWLDRGAPTLSNAPDSY